MNATATRPQAQVYVRFCNLDPADRIARHVEAAFECRVRECGRREREAELRAAVSAAASRLAA